MYDLLQKTEYTLSEKPITLDEAAQTYHDFLNTIICNRRHVFVIGNGGSSGIAGHHVNDLVNMIRVKAFTITDSNLITCMANDYGYESVYSKPLSILFEQNDLLVAISSSGKSKNILQSVNVAKEKGGKVLTLSGFSTDNPLRQSGDLNIWTGANDYGLVESAHFFLLHSMVDTWMGK